MLAHHGDVATSDGYLFIPEDLPPAVREAIERFIPASEPVSEGPCAECGHVERNHSADVCLECGLHRPESDHWYRPGTATKEAR